MTEAQHQRLWTSWKKERSESVFSELVNANINLVYTTALRSLGGDAHLANDVTQSVFIDLIRKNPDISDQGSLAGWLHRHTRYTASKTVRTEQRRRTREQSYHSMESQSPSNAPSNWETIAPHLDQCLQELSQQDRDTLLLRFFNQRNLKDIGAELGISADAAQKRVSRALEKLRLVLTNKGVNLSVSTLATTMSASAVIAAPTGLAAQVSTAGAAAIASSTGFSFLFTTLKSNIIAMKTQYVVTGTAITLIGAPLVYQQMTLRSLNDEIQALKKEMSGLESVSNEYQQWEKTKEDIAEFERLKKDQEELSRLQQNVEQLKAEDAEKKAALLQQLAVEKDNLARAQEEKDQVIDKIQFQAHQVQVINVMKQLGLAAAIYHSKYQGDLPESINDLELDIDGMSKQLEEVPLEGFEYMEHERKLEQFEPGKILFREIESRFDGETYFKAYTFCDGSVQIAQSEDNDFSEFEAKYTATIKNIRTPPGQLD